MDGAELCARDTAKDVICGYCVHLTTKKVMQSTQYVCITAEHVLPMRQLAHKKWLLLHPPEPPFVVVQGDTQLAHLIWRTPITESKDLWYVRLGRRQLIVRMPLVREALERFDAIAERFAAVQPPQKKGKDPRRLRSPFASLGYDLDELDLWRIRSDVRRYLTPDDLAMIPRLRPGEYWALAILSANKEATNPLIIQLTTNTQ